LGKHNIRGDTRVNMKHELPLNLLDGCQQCGECCKAGPCGTYPSDLPPMLERYDMGLPDFFREYLAAVPVGYPHWQYTLLEMVPRFVEAGETVRRSYLALRSTEAHPRRCVFIDGVRCTIQDIKPTSARRFYCAKMTGTIPVGDTNQRRPFWDANQHLFEILWPGYLAARRELVALENEAWRFLEKPAAGTTEPRVRAGAEQELAEVWKRRGAVWAVRLVPLFRAAQGEEPPEVVGGGQEGVLPGAAVGP
jgi:Fe-S-cluster containining protein